MYLVQRCYPSLEAGARFSGVGRVQVLFWGCYFGGGSPCQRVWPALIPWDDGLVLEILNGGVDHEPPVHSQHLRGERM